MLHRKRNLPLLTSCGLALLLVSLPAQSLTFADPPGTVDTCKTSWSGGITVRVVDQLGPLPGAVVTLSHPHELVKRTAVMTDAHGLVRFPVLRPCTLYVVETNFPGFGARRMPEVRVKIDEVTSVTVQLVAEPRATTFTDEYSQDHPVQERVYPNVLPLAPGAQASHGDGIPHVHTGRQRDFKAIVSKIRNVDPLTGTWASCMSPDSIEEMQVITGGVGVNFNRPAGGFGKLLGTNLVFLIDVSGSMRFFRTAERLLANRGVATLSK